MQKSQQDHSSPPPAQQQVHAQQQQQQLPSGGTSGRRSSRNGGTMPSSALTAINEGDEHATLMDVLATRDGPLVEEELWAVCRECCLAVRSLGDCSEAFQTLCLSPDTVAFDGHGNVRLMNSDASDNPADLTCQPPEFYQFGNSYKGHVYSLGSAMLMAAHYAVPDGGKTRHSRRLSDLLADMTEEDYDARADIDRVLVECDAHLRGRSSKEICRAVVAKTREDDVTLPSDAAPEDSSEGSSLRHIPAIERLDASCNLTEDLTCGDAAKSAIAGVGCMSSRIPTISYSADEHLLSLSSLKGSSRFLPARSTQILTNESLSSSKAKLLAEDSHSFPSADIVTAASAFSQLPASDELTASRNLSRSFGGSKNIEQPKKECEAAPSTFLPAASVDHIREVSVATTHRKSLPTAYRSSATHFTPIILSRDGKKSNDDDMMAGEEGDVDQPHQQQNRQPLGSGADPSRLTAKKIKELKKKLVRSRQLVEAAAACGGSADLTSLKDGPSAARDGGLSPPSTREPVAASSPPGEASPAGAASPQSAVVARQSDASWLSSACAAASCQQVTRATRNADSASSPPCGPVPVTGGGDSLESSAFTSGSIAQALSAAAGLVSGASTCSQHLEVASSTAQMSVANISDKSVATQLPRVTCGSAETATTAEAAAKMMPTSHFNGPLAAAPFPTTVPVQFVVQQDPSSGALHLVPLYSSLGSTVFLPPPTLATAVTYKAADGIQNSSLSTTADDTSATTVPAVVNTHRSATELQPIRASLLTGCGGTTAAYRTLLPPEAPGTNSVVCNPQTLHCAAFGGRESSPTQPLPPSPSYSKDSGVGSLGSRRGGGGGGGDPQLIERLLASGNVRHNKLLGQLIKLIRDEFAFDGYLDNGVEDLAMAEYTASLAGLKWDTFSSAITEKYCDLYWEEDLLAQLFQVVNGKPPPTLALSVGAKTKRSKAGSGAGARPPKADGSVGYCGHSPFRPISAGAAIDEAAAGDRLAATVEAAAKDQVASALPTKPVATSRRSPTHRRSSSLTRELSDTGGFDTSKDSTETVVAAASRQGRAQPPTLVRGRSASVQNLISSPNEQRLMGRSFSQSELDRPSVPLRKSDSRVSLTLLGTGLMVSGLSGSMPVIRVQGSGISDDLSSTQARRNAITAGAERSLRCTPRSTRRNNSPSHERRSAMSRCSDGSSNVSTRHSLRPGSDLSDRMPDSKAGSSATSGSLETEKTRAIDVIYYTSTLANRLSERFRQAIDKAEENIRDDDDSANRDELARRLQETEQQLAVHMKHRAKTLKYCRRLPDTVQQGKVAYDQKAVLDKALADLNEANDHLEFLLNVKRHLEMLLAENNSLMDTHVYSLAKCGHGERLVLSAAPENPLLLFKSRVDGLSRRGDRVLHAGTALGLMANLFSRGCFTQQYSHHFFYCYRYFTTPGQLLSFISSKYDSAALQPEQREEKAKVKARSLDLLQAWLEGYYSVDFKHDSDLQDSFTAFLQESVAQNDPTRAEALFVILEDLACGRKNDLTHVSASLRDDIDVTLKVGDREWQHTAKKLSFKLNSSSGKPPSAIYKRGRSGIISCIRNADDPYRDREPYYLTCPRKTEAFSLSDYSSQTIAEQLTLMEQAFFERCHPVHFLNSRAQGIAASLASLGHSAASRALWDDAAAGASGGSLFVGSYAHDAAIQCMIEHSQSLSYWVAAELVSCNSVKSQLALLTKFIYIAKICKEIRNYATCVAVIDGLENLVVRQLPAWKDIPAKSIEELKNVKVFLSSDAMCLTDDEATSAPTVPSVLLFVLHMQQLERGAFTLANGMYKWSKMKSIAKAADQIRLFKQRCYEFESRPELCDDLVSRMKDLCQYDLQILAASRDNNFQKTSTGKWANAFRKLKGAFSN